MKVLVVCQYYYPEPFRINDICEELVKRGHEIQVVTGMPNYPMGEYYDGYQHSAGTEETINGVKVHRCFTVARRTDTLHRFLNYFSYPVCAGKYIRRMKDDFDVVFVNQLSPVMMAWPAIIYKKKNKKKCKRIVLYCLDLWPESLCAGGMKRNSLMYRLFHWISKKIYRQMDKIFVTSKLFAEYFKNEFNIDSTEYLPQYAEDIFAPDKCAKDKKTNTVDLMFAGNIGSVQSVKTIIAAAKITENNERIIWHIVGDGTELENVKEQSGKMPNVIFYGRKPLEEMPYYYSMSDAMIVTMEPNPVLSLTLPGKVQTYMAAGKPIIGAIDGETQSVISEANCGLCGEAGNAEQLADNAIKILNTDKKMLSENSRKYYETHFRRDLFIDRLEKALIGN